MKHIAIIAMILSLGGCEVGCGIRSLCKDYDGSYVDCRVLED